MRFGRCGPPPPTRPLSPAREAVPIKPLWKVTASIGSHSGDSAPMVGKISASSRRSVLVSQAATRSRERPLSQLGPSSFATWICESRSSVAFFLSFDLPQKVDTNSVHGEFFFRHDHEIRLEVVLTPSEHHEDSSKCPVLGTGEFAERRRPQFVCILTEILCST